MAGKSTLNRLELSVADQLTRYHRIVRVPRRVIGKTEHVGDKANPRFIVTTLARSEWDAQRLASQSHRVRSKSVAR